jgi:hypothetical protein
MPVAGFVMIDELRAWWGVKFSSAAPPGFVPKPDRCTRPREQGIQPCCGCGLIDTTACPMMSSSAVGASSGGD